MTSQALEHDVTYCNTACDEETRVRRVNDLQVALTELMGIGVACERAIATAEFVGYTPTRLQ